MKISDLLTVNAIVFIALGIAFAVYGPLAMAFLNVPELDIAGIAYWPIIAFGRMFGAALFGYGFLIWSFSQAFSGLSGALTRRLLRSLVLGNLVLSAAAITQQSQVWLVPAGWLLTAIFTVFTLIYLYTLLIKPTAVP